VGMLRLPIFGRSYDAGTGRHRVEPDPADEFADSGWENTIRESPDSFDRNTQS